MTPVIGNDVRKMSEYCFMAIERILKRQSKIDNAEKLAT
jgi:hypothetical protein